MVIKSVDSKRPQMVARAEVSKVAPTTVKRQEGGIPESGFQAPTQKLINMTGARPKVQLKGNPELLAVVKGAQAAGGTAAAKMPSTVDDFLKGAISESSSKDLKQSYADIKKAINKGDFTAAAKIADGLLSGKANDKEEAIDSELGTSGINSTKTMTSQLDFLAGMEKAGVKPVSYPPTEAQLTKYFSTLKDNPDGAREAFASYTQAFHAHPANVSGKGTGYDVQYGDGKTRVPDDWSEVAGRDIDADAQHIGKQMNDCEGFAFMAEKLLGAAGFKVEHHLTAHGAPAGDHAMVSFKHPSEKNWTIASNDKLFTSKSERDGAEQGFAYASGTKTPKKTQFYTGKTMLESQDAIAKKGKHI